MTFDGWWDTTKAAATPDTFAGWEASCRQAWNAAAREAEQLRAALDDECNRTDSLLTILGVPAERCRSEGGSLIPRRVLTLMGETRADDVADATRFRWMCRYPDWHFIEHLCRQTTASTSAEFLADLRRVIDTRRSVALDEFEQRMPPEQQAP